MGAGPASLSNDPVTVARPPTRPRSVRRADPRRRTATRSPEDDEALREQHGEFRTGASDILLARLDVPGVPEPVTFWMSTAQFKRWRHTHLTVDVVPGRGSGFSLEAPDGV